jgi:hypothetical protein
MSGRTLVLVLAIVGCAPRGNAQDEMGRFSGLARVTCAAGGVGYAAALSEDMPGAGWENRWRVVLSVEVPAPCLKPLEIRGVWIRTTAVSRGSYTIDVPTWGLIEILPGSPQVREAFRRAAPGSESRWKPRIVLRPVGDALELLIEEPR